MRKFQNSNHNASVDRVRWGNLIDLYIWFSCVFEVTRGNLRDLQIRFSSVFEMTEEIRDSKI